MRTNIDCSPNFLIFTDKSRATTVSGVLDLLGKRTPARCTICFTVIGVAVSRKTSSTTASVFIAIEPPKTKRIVRGGIILSKANQ